MLYLVLPADVLAQHKYNRDDVRALFPVEIKNLWINNLTGSLDNKHWIDMVIGTDGQVCKGYYTLHNSGESFYFEGSDSKNELKLVELSPDARTTGLIFGHYDGERFNGKWMNLDKTMQLDMQLSNTIQTTTGKSTDCISDVWHRIYTGKIDEKPSRIYIVKQNSEYTITYYQDSLQLVDVIPSSNQKSEMLKPAFSSLLWGNKLILIDTAELKQIKIMEPVNNDFKLLGTLKQSDAIDFECYEYADYYSRLLIEKPVNSNKKFNKWIEGKMIDWMEDNISELKGIKRDNIATKDRWIQYAEGWIDIDLLTSDYLSGTIYLQSSLKSGTRKVPFIYDLKWSKELKLQDLFDKKFDYKDYFRHVLGARKKEISWSPEIKKWIDGQTFEFCTIKNQGFSFKTELNTIYGEQEILIPYIEIEQHLKNINLNKGLIKY